MKLLKKFENEARNKTKTPYQTWICEDSQGQEKKFNVWDKKLFAVEPGTEFTAKIKSGGKYKDIIEEVTPTGAGFEQGTCNNEAQGWEPARDKTNSIERMSCLESAVTHFGNLPLQKKQEILKRMDGNDLQVVVKISEYFLNWVQQNKEGE